MDATGYLVCVDTIDNDTCDGTWTSISGTSASTNLGRRTTHYWQVRAVNDAGATDANAGSWWSFTTR